MSESPLSALRLVIAEGRQFVMETNRIIEHARTEPLNETWIAVYDKRVRQIASAINAADAVLRRPK